VSEWANFLFDFLGHNVKVHIYKTLTSMHILIKASILVGFAPSAPRCLPLTPAPPPHTNLSDPKPPYIPYFLFQLQPLDNHYLRHLVPETPYFLSFLFQLRPLDNHYRRHLIPKTPYFLSLHMALYHIHTFIVYVPAVVFPSPSIFP
jgi:hypothetical protein